GYGWNLCIDDIFINTTNVDNNPPTVVYLQGTQTYADTEMNLTLRVYDESDLPNQMQATYTVDGQSHDITFNRISRANCDYVATLPAKPNHTTGSIVFHLVDELGNAAESDSYALHWDWQRPILHEGFEDEQFPPAGWTIESLQMSWFSWYRFRAEYATTYFGEEYYVVPPEGERMAGVEWDESEEWGPQDESLITPLIAIDRPTVLTFENSCQYGVSEYQDHYKVDVLNTNTGSWVTLWDAVNQPQWLNNFQEPVSLDLSQYQGQNIRLRWRAHNNGSDILTFSWFIDNVKVIATDTIDNVKETMSLQTSIYPNPADNTLTIKAEDDIQHINIYNVVGIKVMEMTINNKETVIDITNLESGMYLIEIQGIKEKGIKTFIKK
ncbi:MAG: T9SS type A sorting domain-containing protein, partial [Bacteroidales bacterium]|nr:T9SS type A sorting domain-containing protein [Bacteroidales bacterium]